MRYVTLIVFVLLAWLLIEEFVFSDRRSEGLESYGDKWRDLGRRLHLVFGILAVIIILFLAVRFLLSSFEMP
jgi:hypothetical protein